MVEMVEFKLPDVGEGMHEAEIMKWLVSEGDEVRQDQPIVEVQTDKVNAELTSPVNGVIKTKFFSEGETVHVGQTLLIIDPGAGQGAVILGVLDQRHIGSENETKPSIPHQGLFHRALAAPYVRRLAREMKIDIEQVKGSGPAGRVMEEDLHRFKSLSEESLTELKANPKENLQEHQMEERIPIKGIRKKMAEHLVKSVSTIPHVTHVDELEMDALKALRERWKEYAAAKGIKLTFLPFFIKALVVALKEFPILNASIDERTNEIILKRYYHVGIATDTKNGLLVPVIKQADRKTIFQLAEEISRLSGLAREGRLSIDQITGGTFTISNAGSIGGLYATPIINHPEVAILGLHKMESRMVVRNGEGVIRMMMNLSLSFDHRLIDGVTAIHFTNRIKQLLENPELLMMEMV